MMGEYRKGRAATPPAVPIPPANGDIGPKGKLTKGRATLPPYREDPRPTSCVRSTPSAGTRACPDDRRRPGKRLYPPCIVVPGYRCLVRCFLWVERKNHGRGERAPTAADYLQGQARRWPMVYASGFGTLGHRRLDSWADMGIRAKNLILSLPNIIAIHGASKGWGRAGLDCSYITKSFSRRQCPRFLHARGMGTHCSTRISVLIYIYLLCAADPSHPGPSRLVMGRWKRRRVPWRIRY